MTPITLPCGHELPPDTDGQNDDRAKWAATAIVAFMTETGTDRQDALADLLADLRHWADRNGVEWRTELRRGMAHYEAETEEES